MINPLLNNQERQPFRCSTILSNICTKISLFIKKIFNNICEFFKKIFTPSEERLNQIAANQINIVVDQLDIDNLIQGINACKNKEDEFSLSDAIIKFNPKLHYNVFSNDEHNEQTMLNSIEYIRDQLSNEEYNGLLNVQRRYTRMQVDRDEVACRYLGIIFSIMVSHLAQINAGRNENRQNDIENFKGEIAPIIDKIIDVHNHCVDGVAAEIPIILVEYTYKKFRAEDSNSRSEIIENMGMCIYTENDKLINNIIAAQEPEDTENVAYKTPLIQAIADGGIPQQYRNHQQHQQHQQQPNFLMTMHTTKNKFQNVYQGRFKQDSLDKMYTTYKKFNPLKEYFLESFAYYSQHKPIYTNILKWYTEIFNKIDDNEDKRKFLIAISKDAETINDLDDNHLDDPITDSIFEFNSSAILYYCKENGFIKEKDIHQIPLGLIQEEDEF